MGVVLRYFGTAAAGAGDGTTYADRAAFVTAGVVSTIVTNHNFNGSDSLICYLDSGTYALTTVPAFASGSPNGDRLLSIRAAASGTLWTPTDPDWNCCQPLWDTTGMVTITTTTSNILGSQFIHLYGIQFIANVNFSFQFDLNLDWCYVKNTNAGAIAYCGYNNNASNCVFECSGTTYATVFYNSGNRAISNCRLIGNPSAVSGDRRGLWAAAISARHDNLCIVDTLVGVRSADNSNTAITLARSTLVNCVTAWEDQTTNASGRRISDCLIHNSTTGISLVTNTKTMPLTRNLFNSVTTQQSGNGNWDNTVNNWVDTASAADLFVDSANGDYRIKRSSTYWGKNIGAGDAPASSTFGFGAY